MARLLEGFGDLTGADEEKKKKTEQIPLLGKRLKLLLCLFDPDYTPNFYLHVLSDHSEEYLKHIQELSRLAGFPVTLKMLSQDAVEAGHR